MIAVFPRDDRQKISWISKIHYQSATTLSCSCTYGLASDWNVVASYLILILSSLVYMTSLTRNVVNLCVFGLVLLKVTSIPSSGAFAWNNRNASSVSCPMRKPGELLLHLDEAKSVSASFHSCFTGPLERLVVVLVALSDLTAPYWTIKLLWISTCSCTQSYLALSSLRLLQRSIPRGSEKGAKLYPPRWCPSSSRAGKSSLQVTRWREVLYSPVAALGSGRDLLTELQEILNKIWKEESCGFCLNLAREEGGQHLLWLFCASSLGNPR